MALLALGGVGRAAGGETGGGPPVWPGRTVVRRRGERALVCLVAAGETDGSSSAGMSGRSPTSSRLWITSVNARTLSLVPVRG